MHIICKWCFVYSLHVVSIYSCRAASKHCQFWYVLHYHFTTVVVAAVQCDSSDATYVAKEACLYTTGLNNHCHCSKFNRQDSARAALLYLS
jgi:hypothetical protein